MSTGKPAPSPPASSEYSPFQVLNFEGLNIPASPALNVATPCAPNLRKRKRISKDNLDVLDENYRTNKNPSTQEKKKMAQELNMDVKTVNNWFHNK